MCQDEAYSPDQSMPDIQQRLAALHALGPMEYEPGERERIEQALASLDELSREQMQRLADLLP
jgi:hypothetical protein